MGITVINRKTGKKEEEKVYGEKYLQFLYSSYGFFLLPLFCKFSFLSQFYGWLQKKGSSKKKVKPFIDTFGVEASEFEKKTDQFSSFNDFFIRKLKPEARPIVSDSKIATMPADGRYLAFDQIESCPFFSVKGKRFCLETFLNSKELAEKYVGGSLVLVRLCPTDYHRFHFPFDCVPSAPKLINGFLYSVNPFALKKRAGILCENKRLITTLESEGFGKVLFLEIGATNVGSVIQTYTPNALWKKGEEKGYFSFGGSALAIIFEKDKIALDEDLLNATKQGIEVKGEFGQSLGSKYSS